MNNLHSRMTPKNLLITGILSGLSAISFSQTQQITVQVSPTTSKPIKGKLELERSKYFNIAGSSRELSILNTSWRDRYLNDLKITTGRSLGAVFPERKNRNSIREDANRPGWLDTQYFISKQSPNDNGMAPFKSAYGANEGLVCHDRPDAYPAFMGQYSLDDKHNMPDNVDAAAELAALLFKYGYTDFQRPAYFEPINEPGWQFWGDQRFFDLHTSTKRKFDELNIPTEVGGPCYSVGNFFKKNYGSLGQITSFIDNTNFELDFYSFHVYDYMRWSDSDNDFIGAVSTGLPEMGVFDAIAAHTYNKHGKEFTYVGSEHGGYIPNQTNRTNALNALADKYFPGSGFNHEMEKRSIDNFVLVNSVITNTMMFMDNPHIVKKAVPFILLQTANWNPTYYSALLVKQNFDRNSNVWVESKLSYYYEFFKDVKGRRVKSLLDDADIQHMSFVDGNKLIMLFHNQSNTQGNININIDMPSASVQNIKIRRVGRGVDFRPYKTEQTLASLNELTIKDQESIALFVTYDQNIPENKVIEETPYYSTESGVTFSGARDFMINVPDPDQVRFATLRVGIGRQSTDAAAKNITISLNGTNLNIPVEESAERITSNSDYATTRMIQIDPALLSINNVVNVSFDDGGEGGVGAVVIRAGIGDKEESGPHPGPQVPSIPGTIEAENFNKGGPGVAYSDTTAANIGQSYRPNEQVDLEVCSEGGFNVGWVAKGEWLEYTAMVEEAGAYTLSLRVAARSKSGKVDVYFDGQKKVSNLSLPVTNGWQVYQDVSTPVTLTKGQQLIRIQVLDNGFNFNHFKLEKVPSANLLQNSGFESGDLSSWNSWGGASVNTDPHQGSHNLQIAGPGAATQVITVEPNTNYTLTAWAKALAGQSGSIGVKNFGDTDKFVSVTSTSYNNYSVNFTTGNTTTATVYMYVQNNNNQVRSDEFKITLNN